LNEEFSFYRTLLSYLQEERKAIVHSQLEKLTECTKEKENLILKIRVLEEQRINYLNNLSDALEAPVQTFSLTDLAQVVDEPYATQLKDCATSLNALIQSIQEINQSNRALVSHSLDLIRGSLTLLNDLISHNAIYYQTGKVQASEKGGVVFSKSA
jgi:flagellar biosynthesis/type III secretory pathway chaperone